MSNPEWLIRGLGPIQTPEVLDRKVQSLKDELPKHEGQFVLMVLRRWKQTGWDMPEHLTPYVLEENLYLGVIRPPFLQQRPPEPMRGFSISSDKHVIASERSGRDSVKLVAGPIEDYLASMWKLDMPVGERPGDRERFHLSENKEGELALEVIIGDEAVNGWFLNQAQYGRMTVEARQFIEDPKSPPEGVARVKARHFDADVLISYQKIQALLGREITNLPSEIQAQVEAKVLKQKEQVLISLETLTQQELELTKELARIRGIKLPRISFGLEDDTYEREVQQDEGDLRIIKSIPINEERRRIQAQISLQLQKAFELNMHKDPWVIIREPVPGKTISIDVPRLIFGYCQYYEIPIS